jgi:hypothetical protein
MVLVRALRVTVERLRTGASYQWGHFGACNCGHLAQALTSKTRVEIHRAALDRASSWELAPVDDWGDAAIAYCPTSGLPLDDIVGEMLAAGLTLAEIRHLEELSDPRILARMSPAPRRLRRHDRADLIAYLEAWADLMDEEYVPLAAE